MKIVYALIIIGFTAMVVVPTVNCQNKRSEVMKACVSSGQPPLECASVSKEMFR